MSSEYFKAIMESLYFENDCVYLIRSVTGASREYYKIGITSDHYSKRILQIQRNTPFYLEVVRVVLSSNARQLKKKILDKFSEDLVKGEWFYPERSYQKLFIKKVKRAMSIGIHHGFTVRDEAWDRERSARNH